MLKVIIIIYCFMSSRINVSVCKDNNYVINYYTCLLRMYVHVQQLLLLLILK